MTARSIAILSMLSAGLLSATARGQVVPKSSADPGTGRAAWLDEAKYGMFIHWGVYATLAKGEWVMARSKIPVAEYKAMAAKFNPTDFDAKAWVEVAKQAGMSFITITSKHHDGFAMYDSEASDYNIVDHTSFKRDVMRELKDACDEAGIKLGFYYSHTQDWEFPGGAGKKWDPAQEGDFDKYLKKKAKPQLRELMTKYDPTHIWFDTPHSEKSMNISPELGKEFVDIIRESNPDALVNSRLLYHGFQVDSLSPGQLEEMKAVGVDFISYRDRSIPNDSPWEYWETCTSVTGSWGYASHNERNAVKPQKVIMQLTEVVSKGGTYLLNVGPDAKGVFPKPAVETLLEVGEWLEVNGESIYGTRPTIFQGQGDFIILSEEERAAKEKEALATGAGKAKKGHHETDYAWLATGRDGKLYLHFFQWPDEPFVLKSFGKDKVTGAYFLADPGKSPISCTQVGETVTMNLPAEPLDPYCSVLCLTLNP